MKKLIAILMAGILLLSCAIAEDYFDVAKHYLNTYGRWWDYSPELWLEYAAAARAADSANSHTGQAIAATDYILPPEGALTYEQATEIAIQAAGGGQAYRNIPCFLLDGRAVYKVLLHEDAPFSAAVELDAVTGEVLGVYPPLTVEAGYYFVPNAVWTAMNNPFPDVLKLTDDYTTRYGTWWNWTPANFREYSLALRHAREITSRTARAMVETNYVIPPDDVLPSEQIAALAIAAAGASGLSYVNTLYFRLVTDADDRYVCKVILSDGTDYSHAVELDPHTGEILLVQIRDPQEGAGQFLTPAAIWESTPTLAPNG